MKIFAGLVLITLFAAQFALAQTEEPGKNEVMVWGGISPVVRSFDGFTRNWEGQHGLAAIRYSRRWDTSDWVNIKYTVDAIPAAFLRYPDTVATPTGPGTVRIDRVKRSRFAFGGSPFGLQFNFRPRKKIQPFVGLSLSALVFNERTPNELGTKLNFASEGGAGIEYRLADKKAITLGYKWYHISNAGRGTVNPGFDAQLFYLGYTFWGK
ncbi:MAG TPA: acyloxyacyl hydrolase [Pyrinomonadaceae bacterium]|mgnify:FL=1|nr:acyloxyacyl hydrolase [Pyrinomonadaceae bacterium]